MTRSTAAVAATERWKYWMLFVPGAIRLAARRLATRFPSPSMTCTRPLQSVAIPAGPCSASAARRAWVWRRNRPVVVNASTRSLPPSATNTAPVGSSAMPWGPSRRPGSLPCFPHARLNLPVE